MNEFRSPDAVWVESLDRYRDIVPDWDTFRDLMTAPEPVGVRVRTGLIPPETLLRRLERQGFELEPVAGLPSLFRVVAGPRSIAQTVEHWLGLFHIQQSVMSLPVLALSPEPGERVLDLCAAPGGKTTHLAELMKDRGPLVAVDPKEKRLRGLLANVFRLGHPNVLVVAADGRALPNTALFDRVLVDVPCSAEGTLRREGGRGLRRGGKFVSYVTSLQHQLLRRAVLLCRPGGVVVYATCTFAPEENEAVVSRIVESGQVQVEPIVMDIPHAPGLESWEGRPFHPDLRHAWRVYPQHLNSGGLFMVKLRRLSGGSHPEASSGSSPVGAAEKYPGWSPIPASFPGEDETQAIVETNLARLAAGVTELEHWFYNSDAIGELGWTVRGDNLWAHTAWSWPFDSWLESGAGGAWRIVSVGIRAIRKGTVEHEAPSNHFLCRWGQDARADKKVRVSGPELAALLRGEALAPAGRPPGAYALEWDGLVLGRGVVVDRGLVHEIPRQVASRLHAVVESDEPSA